MTWIATFQILKDESRTYCKGCQILKDWLPWPSREQKSCCIQELTEADEDKSQRLQVEADFGFLKRMARETRRAGRQVKGIHLKGINVFKGKQPATTAQFHPASHLYSWDTVDLCVKTFWNVFLLLSAEKSEAKGCLRIITTKMISQDENQLWKYFPPLGK